MDERDAQMDAAGTDVMDLDRRGKRYFVNDCSTRSPALRWFLLDQTMRDVCRATLGDDAYLFNDQLSSRAPTGRRASRGIRTAATSPTSTGST